jgi:predicted acyltransferase (DUF342 family)
MAENSSNISGGLSVGGTLSVGGKATVSGSVVVGHNVKIEGWLEAKNIKGPNKGVFMTLTALQAAYPNPQNGWFAGVGSSTPFAVFVGVDGEWVPTGGGMEITADLDTYESKLNALQETLDEVIRKLGEIDETALRIRENASVATAPVQGTTSGTVLTSGINTGVNSNTLGIG